MKKSKKELTQNQKNALIIGSLILLAILLATLDILNVRYDWINF